MDHDSYYQDQDQDQDWDNNLEDQDKTKAVKILSQHHVEMRQCLKTSYRFNHRRHQLHFGRNYWKHEVIHDGRDRLVGV